MNKQGTSKGVAWVKSNFSSRANAIIDRVEKFLDNVNFIVKWGSLFKLT